MEELKVKGSKRGRRRKREGQEGERRRGRRRAGRRECLKRGKSKSCTDIKTAQIIQNKMQSVYLGN